MRLVVTCSLVAVLAACAQQTADAPSPEAAAGTAGEPSADAQLGATPGPAADGAADAAADTLTATAPDISPFPNGRSGNLPRNLWTTRLGGNRIEATVSDGRANLGVACLEGAEIALRLRPDGPPPARETTVTLASRGVRVGLPMAPDGDGNLRATLPASGLLGPVLSSVADGAALDVTIDGASAGQRFPSTGARDALQSALGPGGCRA
ncbi:MAG: hypothetical protein AAF899_12045 [Pseudomonadota bacterium]